MDQAEITMIANLHKNTGKTLEEWVAISSSQNLEKHGQIVKYLKEQHAFTHGFANLVALKTMASRGAAAGAAAEDEATLVKSQYEGKEQFYPLYEKILALIKAFGADVEVAPKKSYVSLRRKKQFALLNPITKTRFEIGIILKNQPGKGKLEPITAANAMCTHKISLAGEQDLTPEVNAARSLLIICCLFTADWPGRFIFSRLPFFM
jgi:hypothetical protein